MFIASVIQPKTLCPLLWNLSFTSRKFVPTPFDWWQLVVRKRLNRQVEFELPQPHKPSNSWDFMGPWKHVLQAGSARTPQHTCSAEIMDYNAWSSDETDASFSKKSVSFPWASQKYKEWNKSLIPKREGSHARDVSSLYQNKMCIGSNSFAHIKKRPREGVQSSREDQHQLFF